MHNEIASLLAGAHLVIGDIFGRAGRGLLERCTQFEDRNEGKKKIASEEKHKKIPKNSTPHDEDDEPKTRRLGSSLSLEHCDMNCLHSARYAS